MNAHPVQTLAPVFHFLDRMIQEHGNILFMLLVYAAIPLITWILGGGLRRRFHEQPHIIVAPFFMIRPSAPPLIGDDLERARWDCNDIQGQFPD